MITAETLKRQMDALKAENDDLKDQLAMRDSCNLFHYAELDLKIGRIIALLIKNEIISYQDGQWICKPENKDDAERG